MFEEKGADLKRRFFKNTTAAYLMTKCKQLEDYNKILFTKFMESGHILVKAANEGDLNMFKACFTAQVDKEIMYWHVTKALKEAVKKQQLEIVDFIIEDLDTPLDHEAFDGYLHNFIFMCQLAEMQKDDFAREINQQILRYLIKGFGKGKVDQMDKANSSTPLHIACEILTDLTIIETLVESGGADVNSVNNSNGMPLNIVKTRLKSDPENDVLQDIYEFLKRKGAKRDWRSGK